MFLLLLANISGTAQDFPAISTQAPDKQIIEIPADLQGKKSILFLAFSAEAEEMLDNWYAPVYTMFIDESGINAMAYDCHVKLVMMFTGSGQAAASGIMKKIRSHADEELNNYLLFYMGEFKEHMRSLGLTKKSDAYVFVLNEEGKVMFQDIASYSESKLEKIAEMVEL